MFATTWLIVCYSNTRNANSTSHNNNNTSNTNNANANHNTTNANNTSNAPLRRERVGTEALHDARPILGVHRVVHLEEARSLPLQRPALGRVRRLCYNCYAMLCYTIPHCTILYCTILSYTIILYCTILYYT